MCRCLKKILCGLLEEICPCAPCCLEKICPCCAEGEEEKKPKTVEPAAPGGAPSEGQEMER